MISNKLDLADAGLAAFIDRENKVHAPIRQIDQALGHRGFVATILLVGVLDSADVGLGGRLVVRRVRLRLHLNFELLRLDLFVALESHSIDDLGASGEADDNLAVLHLGADI